MIVGMKTLMMIMKITLLSKYLFLFSEHKKKIDSVYSINSNDNLLKMYTASGHPKFR